MQFNNLRTSGGGKRDAQMKGKCGIRMRRDYIRSRERIARLLSMPSDHLSSSRFLDLYYTSERWYTSGHRQVSPSSVFEILNYLSNTNQICNNIDTSYYGGYIKYYIRFTDYHTECTSYHYGYRLAGPIKEKKKWK